MPRPRRVFGAESLALEGRRLLAAGAASPPARGHLAAPVVQPGVGFAGYLVPTPVPLTQVVTQQAGEVTVPLAGMIQPGTGSFSVVVATDPSSPAVGVNVGAVHQTFTFTGGYSQDAVTVPILAGAPNPGEVDVALTITPVDPPPGLTMSGPLELRILASDAQIPPSITSAHGSPRDIVLTFSKPMDPAAASNVNNYAVHAQTTTVHSIPLLFPINFLTFPAHMDSPGLGDSVSHSTRTLPLRAAVYDPATNSVTLVLRRPLTFAANVTVTQAPLPGVSPHPRPRPDPGPPLTDRYGNAINGDTTAGRFSVSVLPGTQTTP